MDKTGYTDHHYLVLQGDGRCTGYISEGLPCVNENEDENEDENEILMVEVVEGRVEVME